jgi:hypothetical protein
LLDGIKPLVHRREVLFEMAKMGKSEIKNVVEKYVKLCLNISNSYHGTRRVAGEIYQIKWRSHFMQRGFAAFKNQKEKREREYGQGRPTGKAMEIKWLRHFMQRGFAAFK